MIENCMFWSIMVTVLLALIIIHMLWEDKKYRTQGKVKVIYILAVTACGTGLTFIVSLLIKVFSK